MHRRTAGFTLIEVMIVILILGIVAAIALPSYSNQVARSRRSDCMGVLLGFAQAMEKYRAVNFTYLGAATAGADTGAPANTLYPDQCPIEGDTPFYNLTIQAATANSFTVQAASTGTQADDGSLRVNSLGQRFWDKDNDGDYTDAGNDNWNTD
jgi:type IV pilus assembly protein PilE